MPKVRLLYVEAESNGTDDASSLITAALTGAAAQATPASVMVAPPPAAIPLDPPPAMREIEAPDDQERPHARDNSEERAPRPRAKKPLAGKPDLGVPPHADPDGPTVRVLNALTKKPMSSLDLTEATKLEPSQVYQACARLKEKGRIESRNDEEDGTRRWYLVKA